MKGKQTIKNELDEKEEKKTYFTITFGNYKKK
jgi:hypothetical protein